MNSNLHSTYPEVDLTNCDREPIHIPGSIQPHGLLLAFKEHTFEIVQASTNIATIFQCQVRELIGQSLSLLLDPTDLELLSQHLRHQDISGRNPIPLSVEAEGRKLLFDGIIHRNDGLVLLELEPARTRSNLSFLNVYDLLRNSISKIQNTATLQELCEKMVREIGKLTGFDRVMMYQLDPVEGYGTVIAECKAPQLEPYLGLRYPASDIPKQARQLYYSNWLRIIPDIRYQPSPIVPELNPFTDRPLDLSFSVLRSVSPIHIQYLENMGVRASMSISLIHKDRLWGLIACHHYSPKYIAYEVRKTCEFLGQIMSLEIDSKENNQDYDYKIELKSIVTRLIEYMSVEDNFIDGLVGRQPNVLELVGASGAAIYFDDRFRAIGKTPDKERLDKLIDWIESAIGDEPVFQTDCLSKFYKEAEQFKQTASGLLAIPIARHPRKYVLWFRPEVVQTVKWAGNPNKPVEVEEDGSESLTPRHSFDLWKETVYGRSLPWKACEVDAALELRTALIHIVLRKAEELQRLNEALQHSEAHSRQQASKLAEALERLKRTQTQLIQTEKMSSLGQLVAGIAHEINNPINFIYGNLTHADNYTQDLINLLYLYRNHYPVAPPDIEAQAEEVDLEFLIEDLPKVLQSMKVGAERVREIVRSLRSFSRLDEADMKPVDIHEGIENTLMILQYRLNPEQKGGIEIIREYEELPLVECYAGQLNQVFMNIISNAIDALDGNKGKGKTHAEKSPKIWIRTAIKDRDWVSIRIADNGPGIEESVLARLFDPFFTTKPTGKGTGLGLAIGYQIITEKHGGKLYCVSQKKRGAEFVIEIPQRQPIQTSAAPKKTSERM
ncbi:GAF domain-containing protein [Oxynema sp. CENA135]|uniref:ATP-binding protein n=1 Tax=Oxynema sp. CENA135 TaxID=984206 RepID=UPI00190E37D6|nr:ATP-binding protein [Oxynema sp. CENA135]MBK4731489.1 GAF domain-containing protein [Oxynema sp. CENA135]